MRDVMKQLSLGLDQSAEYDDDSMLAALDAREGMGAEGLDMEMGVSAPDDAPLDPAVSVNDMPAPQLPFQLGQDADLSAQEPPLGDDERRKQEIMTEVIQTRMRATAMQTQGAAETRIMAKKVSS